MMPSEAARNSVYLDMEFTVAYLCTTSGFSFISGLVTDGIPIPELIPFSLLVLGLYAVIPFRVPVTRHKILPLPLSSH